MEFVEVKSRDGSETWQLRYTNRALRWLERNSGLKLAGLNEQWVPSFEEMTWIVAAGLYHENPTITLEDADEVIDAVGLTLIFETAMAALQAMTGTGGDDAPAANGSDPKNALGTGAKPSGRPPASG